MKCVESDEEKPTSSQENFLQLSCFISQEVKYMLSGIKSVRSYEFIILDFDIKTIESFSTAFLETSRATY